VTRSRRRRSKQHAAPDAEDQGWKPEPRAGGGPSHRPRFDSVWAILTVAGVLAIGIGLRFFARSDLWADEVLSVNISRLPLSDLEGALRQDGAPPLYYALLHFWMRIFGTSNEAVRALSGVFGVVTLIPAWYVGRRLDERRARAGLQQPGVHPIAWTLTLLLAASPFAIRYSTEARMYSLVILLVFVGYLALARALERPSWGRLLCVAVVTSLLLYTHYWSFALLAVVGVWLLTMAVRGAPELRRPAALAIGAMAVGTLSFLPWLSVFRYQNAHTGTPWGGVVSPVASFSEAFKAFGGNTHAVGWAVLLMVVLAVFARAVDRRHFEVDLWTQRGVRTEAGLALATLALGLILARITGTTFEGRYAAVMFPLFLAAAAFGITVFSSRTVRYSVLALLLIGGFWGGASNALRNRTQAFEISNAIDRDARANDLVVYCPDSIGTDVSRLLRDDVREVGLPGFRAPGRIDWTDYAKRVDAIQPVDAMREIVKRAGSHDIWFVYTSGSQAVQKQCGLIADALLVFRPIRLRVVEVDPFFFEHQGLYRYPPVQTS
jgi:mannosyltransferase